MAVHLDDKTQNWVFGVFCNMDNLVFTKELTTLKEIRRLYDDNDLIDSFVSEYIDDFWDIARDSLVYRYLNNRCSDLRLIQGGEHLSS